MLYRSTRGGVEAVTASRAILQGLAEDGGLFVPETVPALPVRLEDLADLSYSETALAIMEAFLTDFTREELQQCIAGAYDAKFDIPEIVRLKEADGAYYMELFHGSTIAFKDMALSILPHLMTTAAAKNAMKEDIVILTATSGDTGKAALAGFADVPHTRIVVFYPKDGVSWIQERQMVTQKGDNTAVIGIRGNFDDAQNGVKAMFNNAELKERLARGGYRLSSANSINIGRLVPQIVYYVYAYGQLMKQKVLQAGEPMNVTVPTGNFGNILAAYYAKRMGLPIAKLLCASNDNRVLVDFFHTGCYDRNRPFILTTSPSMDILISSNLERLIYEIAGEDASENRALMQELSREGRYRITPAMQAKLKDFYSDSASTDEVAAQIAVLYEKSGYVIDTHTAVASCVYDKYRKSTGDKTPTVIASTASPYKFPHSVLSAIDKSEAEETGENEQDVFAKMERLAALSGVSIPAAVEELKTAPVRHNTVCGKDQMQAVTEALLLKK